MLAYCRQPAGRMCRRIDGMLAGPLTDPLALAPLAQCGRSMRGLHWPRNYTVVGKSRGH